jgi:hypothetical protein
MTKYFTEPFDQDQFSDLERLVHSAKDWVVPSEQLRPQVVEAARDFDLRKVQFVKLRNFLIVSSAIWLLVLVVFLSLRAHREELTAPNSQQVERMSSEYSTRYRYDQNWGLVEAFSEARRLESQPAQEAALR